MRVEMLVRHLRDFIEIERELHVWLVVWGCLVAETRVGEPVVDLGVCHGGKVFFFLLFSFKLIMGEGT